MAQQIINYSTFEDWSNDLNNKNKDLRRILDDIQKRINSLEGDYDSKAATTIQEKIRGMTPRFEAYEQVVNQYVTHIKNTGASASNTVTGVDSDAQKFK